MTDPDQILDQYLDGDLSPEQLADFEAELCRDPAFADEFASAMLIDSCLNEKYQWQELVTALHLDDTTADETDDAGQLSAHDLVAVGGYALRLALTSKPAKRIYAYAGVAAAVLLAFVLFNPFGGNDDVADAPIALDDSNDSIEPGPVGPALSTPVATLTATHDAAWSPNSAEGALAPGSQLRTGQTLTLTAGFAEITTHRGAVAILEAPATIELLNNDNALRLHAGKLVGICETPSSQGFIVRTAQVDVTDLGTRFALDASDVAATQIYVMDGEVDISADGHAPLLLRQGQSLGTDRVGAAGNWIVEEYQPEQFHRLTSYAAGVLEMSDTVQWLNEPLDQADRSDWPRAGRASVFAELSGHRLAADLPLTHHEPGNYHSFNDADPSGVVPAGTDIHSYIVFAHAGGDPDGVRTQATIRFEGEVLGVIANRRDAMSFTQIVQSPERVFSPAPFNSPWLGDTTSRPDDYLTLSPNRRTLSIDFTVLDLSCDTLRVIVRARSDEIP
jgi:hypothetical protein